MSVTPPPQDTRSRPPVASPGALGGQGGWPVLLLNAVVPFGVYQVLSRAGVDPIPALAAAAVFPLLGTVLAWVRSGRPDAIGLLALLFFGLGIAVAAVTANASVVLYQGAVVNVVSGLLCFASLLWARPLLFYVSRQFAAGDEPEAVARYDALWRRPAFRTAQRTLTVAWGSWGLLQAAVRVAMTAFLPIAAVLAVWPLLDLLVTVLLVSWSITYSRSAARDDAAPPAAPAAP
jgi:hypothetical protein